MLTQGEEGLLPLPPLRTLVTDRKWKVNVEIAPNCPRCDSSNTKFCYYNNYSLTQPRYFCKNCRRYWTKGGSLRNVPIGGGCRKYRRGRSSARMTTSIGRNLFPSDASSSSSMATSGEEGAVRSDSSSTIDLSLLYAKFLNHQPTIPELPIHLQLPQLPSSVDQSRDAHFEEMQQQVFHGEFDMNHKQEERVPQFMSLDSNGCYGLMQPLMPTEALDPQEMFIWSNPPRPPLMPSSSFSWQGTHIQRFEPVAENQLTLLHSNPLNGNNWRSFDLPEL